MSKRKTIALIAHDDCKGQMALWAKHNEKVLLNYNLIATNGTAKAIMAETILKIEIVAHGPDGGDVRVADRILDKLVDKMIFFIDTKSAQAHEHDIQMLIRTAVSENIPFALNRKTADYLITSELA